MLKQLTRSRPTAVAALACAVTGLTLSACGGQTPSSPSQSPEQLLSAALKNGTARGSVHVWESARSGARTITFVDDLTAHTGRQEIAVSPDVRGRVVIAGAHAYLSGDQTALVRYFGLPSSAARQVGSRWVSIPVSSKRYAVVARDATLPSELGEFALTGSLSETPPITVHGQSLIGIKGNPPAAAGPATGTTVTVYLTRTGEPLPMAATYDYGNGRAVAVEFSGWGRRLRITAPPNAVAQTSVSR